MIKKFTSFMLAALICVSFSVISFAQNEIPDERLLPRLNDEADLLTEGEENELLSTLDALSEENEFDFVIVTVNSLEGETPQSYADDYFDYNGFGYGENADGALLLLNMGERDWYISTSGRGIDLIGEDWQYIGNQILPYLSGGDYVTAFTQFAYICEGYVTGENSYHYNDNYEYYDDYYYDDYRYDYDYTPNRDLGPLKLPASIIIGMLISFFIMFGFRSQLKSVRRKPAARDYQVPDSMRVTEQSDMYLYSRVSRTPRQTQSNTGARGGRGGGVHVGSSGRSHGGGGGKF